MTTESLPRHRTADELLDDSETVHIICCRDETLAQCGYRQVFTMVGEDAPVTCIVCLDLVGEEFCPLGGPCTGPGVRVISREGPA
jgi:hypothetical protein